ncbi:hypothetical protein L1987_78142 [Smallanthus sonchifolius]|uniref:Uncharacterized protein n=1 Tax=Smallanthus sonchifolius TaxID=185202 RepID=A0ACB8ZC26_9ASTR|nr:hypothetical protein L1987_78142 [Smallanthus sonchifolius]
MAGCNTAMSNIMMSMIVMLTPFVITLLFKYTSNAILASVIISAVLGLTDYDAVVLHWKIDKFDFLACIRAFFGVVFVSVEICLVITESNNIVWECLFAKILLQYTSNAILASIMISAVLGLTDFDAVVLPWKIDKFDFLACIRAFFGVVFVSVEICLVITESNNIVWEYLFAKILLQVRRLRIAVLGGNIFLPKFFYKSHGHGLQCSYTSNAILASIIVSAVLGLTDFDAVVLPWKIDKFDFLACIRAFFGVVLVFVEIGHVITYTSNAILTSIIIYAVLGLIGFDAVFLHWKIDKIDILAYMPAFFGVVFVSVDIGLVITLSNNIVWEYLFAKILLQYTSNAIVASIIISTVLGLIDFDAVVLLWKIDKFDFLACMRAFFGVVFVLDEIGLVITVGISFCQNSATSNTATDCSARPRHHGKTATDCSAWWEYLFAKILLQVTRPRTAVLGKISKTSLLHGGLQYRDVEYCDVYDYDAYFFLITLLFKYTSNAILASIIVSAVLGLTDFDAVVLPWKIDKFDFLACIRAFFGVVFVSVEICHVITYTSNAILTSIIIYAVLGLIGFDAVVLHWKIDKFDFLACIRAFFGVVFVSVEICLVITESNNIVWEYLFAKILLQYTSNAIVASIIISTVLGLIDFDAVVLLWKIDKFDFLACMRAFFGVVFVLDEIGLVITVGISFCQNSATSNTATDCSARPRHHGKTATDCSAWWEYLFTKILLQVTRPRTAVLGKISKTSLLHGGLQYRDVEYCDVYDYDAYFFLITLLFKYTSNAILASIIVSAVLGLTDFDAVVLPWKIDKFDFLACIRAFFGVVFVSVEICHVITLQMGISFGQNSCTSGNIFLPKFFYKSHGHGLQCSYTTNAILASIIISSVLGVIDFDAVVLHWKIDKIDILAYMPTCFGVVFVSVDIGLVVTVSNNIVYRWEYLLAKILLQVRRPRTEVLGKIPKTSQLHGGWNTTMSNILMSMIVMLTPFVFTLLFKYTSNAILTSIIISAFLGLIDFDAVVLHWKIDKFDFIACIRAFFGVVFVSVEIFLVITYTSNAILASIIISTVLGLIDFDAVVLLWKIDKFDFLACMRAFFGVFLFWMRLASSSRWEYLFAKILLQVTRPRTSVLAFFGVVFVLDEIGLVITCSVRSRRQVNYMAVCNTAMSNIVMSMISMLTTFVITLLFKYTSNAILASIIISTVLGLIDFDAVVLLWKIDKFDFLACMRVFFGVVFVSDEIGLLIMVGISFAKILLQVTRPRIAVLVKIPKTSLAITVRRPRIAELGGNIFLPKFFYKSHGHGLQCSATSSRYRWEYLLAKILVQYTSNAILTSIIIYAVLGLIGFDAVVLHWKIDKFDFLACIRAFFVVVFVSVEICLVITESNNIVWEYLFAKILLQVTRPRTAVLGKISKTSLLHGGLQYRDVEYCDVYDYDAYFFLITYLFKYTTNAILASIIISSVLGLIDFDAVVLHWKIDKIGILAYMPAFFGVVFVSVDIGLVITYTSNAILTSIIITAFLGLIDFDAVVLHWKIDKFDFIACIRAFFGVVFVSVEIFLVITNAIQASIIISAVLDRIDFDAVVLHWKIDKFDFLAYMPTFFGVDFVSVEIGLVITVRRPRIAELASIIISTVLGLIDFDAVVLLWKIDKFDFLACMRAFFGVVFVSDEIGLLIMCSLRSRRQVNYMAGCNTAMSNIVMSLIVMLTTFVITLLFKYTSNAILASIIISAVLGLIDFDTVVLQWKIDK